MTNGGEVRAPAAVFRDVVSKNCARDLPHFFALHCAIIFKRFNHDVECVIVVHHLVKPARVFFRRGKALFFGGQTSQPIIRS